MPIGGPFVIGLDTCAISRPPWEMLATPLLTRDL